MDAKIRETKLDYVNSRENDSTTKLLTKIQIVITERDEKVNKFKDAHNNAMRCTIKFANADGITESNELVQALERVAKKKRARIYTTCSEEISKISRENREAALKRRKTSEAMFEQEVADEVRRPFEDRIDGLIRAENEANRCMGFC